MKFTIDKPIRLIELFAGIGSQAMALRDIGADFEHYRVVEFDRYPVASYNAIHGTNFPTMDITKIHGTDLGIVETDKYTYILTYSFPCQDLSLAGKGRGMTKGSGTRSGLLWEVERLLKETENLPQILVMENVPQVHGTKNMADFQSWLDFLSLSGYTTYWQDMNAVNYGIPQSRNRCLAVSILGNWEFDFPKPIAITTVMRDFLEDTVDDRFYLTSDKAKILIDQLVESGKLQDSLIGGGQTLLSLKTAEVLMNKESLPQEGQRLQQPCCPEISKDSATTEATQSLSVRDLGFIEKGTGKHQSNTVYGTDGYSPTITAVSWKEPLKVIVCQKLS